MRNENGTFSKKSERAQPYLAYCVSLECNVDPRAEDYMSDQLRRHAYTCISHGKIQRFPKRSTLRKHQGYLREYQIDINCL